VPAERRRPRPIFLLIGVVSATALGVGLFTSIGTGSGNGNGSRDVGERPIIGSVAPPFTLAKLGGGELEDPADGGGNGHPAVLLFFGNWCAQCHGELPALAAAVRRQRQEGGPLAKVAVQGVDSYDSAATARRFTRSSGVDFPVGLDPDVQVTSGLYYFNGDPDAVFIDGAGRITAIRYGPLSVQTFVQLERSIVTPSGT
jgi:thiol-disulfide isomerase/thioredoxin